MDQPEESQLGVVEAVKDESLQINTKKNNTPEPFKELFSKVETIPDPEGKVRATISFMEETLGRQTGVPHFKSFWEARDLCLQLFKENITHQAREVFWERYKELSKEARTLKEMLDKQSAFAVEQFQLALDTLEKEVAAYEENTGKADPFKMESSPATLDDNLEFYQKIQTKLSLLNAYAVRINTLRKDLVNTEMRIRHKNLLFQQLSKVGDQVFPQRKTLISEISQKFVGDVDQFIADAIEKQNERIPPFVLRGEIKALQQAAKELTINTQAFTETRQKLSKAWDSLKEVLKEKKRVKSEQRASSKKERDEFSEKLTAFNQAFAEGTISLDQAQLQLKEMNQSLRSLDLDYGDVKALKEEIKAAREPLSKKEEELEEQRKQEIQERQRILDLALQELKNSIAEAITADDRDADELQNFVEEAKVKVKEFSISKYQRRDLEQSLKPLNDIIAEKREQALLNLSEDDQKALQQLKEVLRQRKERRTEIKEQLEVCRKEAGSSGLDFEKAMAFNELMQIEKERLEHINEAIKDIESKISALEGKI